MVLDVIKQGPIHSRELSRRIGISRFTVDRALSDLTHKRLVHKYVKRIGKGDSFVVNYEAV